MDGNSHFHVGSRPCFIKADMLTIKKELRLQLLFLFNFFLLNLL